MNYQVVEASIANCQPYKHGSSHAEYRETEKGRIYEVYSYQTLIFSLDMNTGNGIFWSDRYYSQTTSRLQNIIKRHHDTEGINNVEPEKDAKSDHLKTVANVMALGDLFGETQKEKNDWKARMLKAGLENKGLIMPEDWDQLDEATKTARLDGAIEALKQ